MLTLDPPAQTELGVAVQKPPRGWQYRHGLHAMQYYPQYTRRGFTVVIRPTVTWYPSDCHLAAAFLSCGKLTLRGPALCVSSRSSWYLVESCGTVCLWILCGSCTTERPASMVPGCPQWQFLLNLWFSAPFVRKDDSRSLHKQGTTL